jgi:hypothetical protein
MEQVAPTMHQIFYTVGAILTPAGKPFWHRFFVLAQNKKYL